MLQSSITVWLKKPAAVTKVDARAADNALEPVPKTVEEPSSLPSGLNTADVASHHVAAVHGPLTQAFALKPLPPNVEFVSLTEDLMPSFKRLNSLLLPIPYPAQFYIETMTEPHHSVTLMALWHPAPLDEETAPSEQKPQLVGAIRCRVLPGNNLYISTIGLLAPYRSHGIATHLLQRIASKAAQEHGVKYITAHVWEANEDGLEWYKKRGFEVIGEEEEYYRKLKPSGAILVKRPIGVGDLLPSADARHSAYR